MFSQGDRSLRLGTKTISLVMLGHVLAIILVLTVDIHLAFAEMEVMAPVPHQTQELAQGRLASDDVLDVTLPFTDAVYKTYYIGSYTVLETSNHGLWVVTEKSRTVLGFTPAWEQAYFYQDGDNITLSLLSSGYTFDVIPMPDARPISSEVFKTYYIGSYTTLEVSDHGLWVVTKDSRTVLGFTPEFEGVYVYRIDDRIKLVLKQRGYGFDVIEMPDAAPIFSSMTLPYSIAPGTVLLLDNEQYWRATEDSRSVLGFSSVKEDVTVYAFEDHHFLSLYSRGYAFDVEYLGGGQEYTLTVDTQGSGSGVVTGPGIDCGTDCSESYTAGSSVTLTATPELGSAFVGWAGACTDTAMQCHVVMNEARDVTATFLLSDAPCPAEVTYSERSQRPSQLNLLRQFRDDVLSSSIWGRELIRIYYRHSNEVSQRLIAEPRLAIQAFRLLKQMQPHLEAAVTGVIPQLDKGSSASIHAFVEELIVGASAELATDLSRFKSTDLNTLLGSINQ